MFDPSFAVSFANSLRLPPLRQIGIVVKSIQDAVGPYEKALGIGPWFRLVMKDSAIERAGKPLVADIDIALAYSGALQLELIEPRGGDATIYDEHLEAQGEGLHHLGFSVRGIERHIERASEQGIGVMQRGFIKSGGGAVTRYAYLDSQPRCGIIVELIETKLMGVTVGMSPALFRVGRLTGEVRPLSA